MVYNFLEMKYFFSILATALIVGFGITAYFMGWLPTISFQKPRAVSTVSTQIEATPAPTIAPTGKSLIKAGGVLVFKAYSLEVPIGWESLKEGAPAGDIELDKLTLTKDGYKISLLQAATGGAPCLYPGDPDVEGPSSRFTKFIEFTVQSGELMRKSSNDIKGFTVCEKQGVNGYGAPTSFGHVSITLPATTTQAVLTEIDAIVASLKKI